ncbi:MAG: hypothetical protein PHU61_00220 [Candidatus Absconditabacteria bacterium]|nr:hypothetical protein [Candidatus Absconditabacteria bacterium]MDD3868686.1 hypothetical protein [Candidatus Absconditabacteria bacterium]MDD4714167.1 hypothetical protein [Candidatus Absconditabacteria bacterium]
MQHPGIELKSIITEKGRTQKKFAVLLGKKVSEVNELIKGKRNITIPWDYLLHQVVDTPLKYWVDLQTSYDYHNFLGKEALELSSQETLENRVQNSEDKGDRKETLAPTTNTEDSEKEKETLSPETEPKEVGNNRELEKEKVEDFSPSKEIVVIPPVIESSEIQEDRSEEDSRNQEEKDSEQEQLITEKKKIFRDF